VKDFNEVGTFLSEMIAKIDDVRKFQDVIKLVKSSYLFFHLRRHSYFLFGAAKSPSLIFYFNSLRKRRPVTPVNISLVIIFGSYLFFFDIFLILDRFR
jgi:hypothetical protein